MKQGVEGRSGMRNTTASSSSTFQSSAHACGTSSHNQLVIEPVNSAVNDGITSWIHRLIKTFGVVKSPGFYSFYKEIRSRITGPTRPDISLAAQTIRSRTTGTLWCGRDRQSIDKSLPTTSISVSNWTRIKMLKPQGTILKSTSSNSCFVLHDRITSIISRINMNCASLTQK